jgi:TusA-related sulfurtransferase
LKAKKALSEMESGQLLKVRGDRWRFDARLSRPLRKQTGNELLEQQDGRRASSSTCCGRR